VSPAGQALAHQGDWGVLRTNDAKVPTLSEDDQGTIAPAILAMADAGLSKYPIDGRHRRRHRHPGELAVGGAGIIDCSVIPPKVADYDLVTQVIAQCKGVATAPVWSGVGSLILYKVIDVLVAIRAPVEKEREGPDITDHGERAYTM
jgi:ammonia channel protein AmtB